MKNKTLIILAVAAAFTLAGSPALASDACVPSEASTQEVFHPAVGEPTLIVDNPHYVPESTAEKFDYWQRYSWTGGPHASDTAPAFPSSNWNPNTKSDPHGIGQAGAYYRSNGNSGKGDWFYLEAVMKTVTTPAVGEPTMTIENPDYTPERIEVIHTDAVVCEDPVKPTDPPVEEVPGDETPPVTEEPSKEAPSADAPTETVEIPLIVERQEILAETGREASWPIAIAGVLAILGGGALFLSRKI